MYKNSREQLSRLNGWSDPNLLKTISRLAVADQISYRSGDYEIEIEDYQFNSFEKAFSKIRNEAALAKIGGGKSFSFSYFPQVVLAAARSRLKPFNKGLLKVTRRQVLQEEASIFPYIRLARRPSKVNLYVINDRNELDLKPEDLMSILARVKSDRTSNPYSITDLELNLLAHKHKQAVFKMIEIFKNYKDQRIDEPLLSFGAYNIRLLGTDKLEGFSVSFHDHFKGQYQDTSMSKFEILPTTYGPTISTAIEQRTSSQGFPYGDLNALRLPINNDLFEVLEPAFLES